VRGKPPGVNAGPMTAPRKRVVNEPPVETYSLPPAEWRCRIRALVVRLAYPDVLGASGGLSAADDQGQASCPLAPANSGEMEH
jgi:hypothetical protein